MSKRYPIIAVTGSSGAGTTTVKVAFEHIFYRLQVNAAFIEGDSFHPHNWEEAEPFGQEPGTFTPWEDLPKDTDLLFYEGLHGAVVTEKVNVAQYVDLLVGVVPIVNLEWIQKIHRDTAQRG